jgi:dolichol-phosphate mannosyltransferase
VEAVQDSGEVNSLGRRKVTAHAVRLLKFGLVGLSGLVVNSIVLYVAAGVLGIHYLIGATIATQASTVWNFVFSDQWVFSDASSSSGPWQRFGMFWLMNNIALAARWPMLFFLTSILGINYLVSNVLTLVVVMFARYAFSYAVIWRSRESAVELPA